MIPARGLPRLGPEPLAGQEQLFVPAAPQPPSLDEMRPPLGVEQLGVTPPPAQHPIAPHSFDWLMDAVDAGSGAQAAAHG